MKICIAVNDYIVLRDTLTDDAGLVFKLVDSREIGVNEIDTFILVKRREVFASPEILGFVHIAYALRDPDCSDAFMVYVTDHAGRVRMSAYRTTEWLMVLGHGYEVHNTMAGVTRAIENVLRECDNHETS